MTIFAALLNKVNKPKKVKLLIVINIAIILLIIFIIRISIIIHDLNNNTRAFENTNSLNVYGINLFVKPFSIIADKYAIKKKKKIAIFYNYDKPEITNNERNNCYITVVKRPNIFLQNKIDSNDFISINMQIAAIVNNDDNNVTLESISSLMDFTEKNKMVLVLNKNSQDIKEAVVGWYESYIKNDVCNSIIQKIVPLGKYSINDIGHKQSVLSTKPIEHGNIKYFLSLDGLHLVSNELISNYNIIDFLKKDIDIIFVNSSELNDVKNIIHDKCKNYYLNNDFAKMLYNIQLKNISETPLENNEIAIGLVNDIQQFGKVIYSSSSNKEALVTWLIANGQNKTDCHAFFQFLRENKNILNKYSIEL